MTQELEQHLEDGVKALEDLEEFLGKLPKHAEVGNSSIDYNRVRVEKPQVVVDKNYMIERESDSLIKVSATNPTMIVPNSLVKQMQLLYGNRRVRWGAEVEGQWNYVGRYIDFVDAKTSSLDPVRWAESVIWSNPPSIKVDYGLIIYLNRGKRDEGNFRITAPPIFEDQLVPLVKDLNIDVKPTEEIPSDDLFLLGNIEGMTLGRYVSILDKITQETGSRHSMTKHLDMESTMGNINLKHMPPVFRLGYDGGVKIDYHHDYRTSAHFEDESHRASLEVTFPKDRLHEVAEFYGGIEFMEPEPLRA